MERIATGDRRKRMRRIHCCWISLLILIANSDWARSLPHYLPMEDAIAEKDVQKACRRNGGALLCRLEELRESELLNLDPCLCSHFIYKAEMSAAVPEEWQKHSSGVKFLLSTSLARWMQVRDLSGLLSEIREGRFDGVDIVIEEEAGETEARATLKELNELLSKEKKVVSLTFLESGFSERILSGLDPVQFTFVTDFGKKDAKQEMSIPRNKILYGFSMKEDGWNGLISRNGSQKCAEIMSLVSDEESEHRNRMKDFLDKIRHATKEKQMGGIHIRSLAEDDPSGACGMNPFPTVNFIRNKLSRDPEPFGNFADLDIVLSTGESQEVPFVLDPDIPREDLKKLPCERVGFYRHPMDCTKFYHCSEYRAATTRFNQSGPYAGFLYKCPNGLVYDERQGSCIWPSWSDPCRGSGELLPVPAKKFSCVTPGFHVDPDNCKYFYYCSDLGDGMLEAFEFLCPSDLLGFDEKKLLCNWKWTVVECNSNGSDANDKITSYSEQGKVPVRNRISKALSLHSYIPSLSFFNPFLYHKNTEFRNETSDSSLHSQSAASRNEAPNASYTVSNTFISKQNDEKFGTAVWQRSGIGEKENNNNRSSAISPVRSYTDGLILNKTYFPDNNTESERPFKGRVIKLDLKERNNQNSKPRQSNEKKNERISSERNSDLYAWDIKSAIEHKNYAIFENIANRVVNDENETPTDRKPSPFANVKCSKLLNKNREHEELNTLGCTGEVSLTVKLNREKDPHKYTLREDQITRSYQESQRISHQKIPTENKENRRHDQSEPILLVSSADNEGSKISRKNYKSDFVSAVPNNIRPQTHDFEAVEEIDSINTGPAEHSPQLPPSYEKNMKYFDENRTGVLRNQTVKSESMPIHFYPQGVLLNINLAHVNQIPPDVLLEVDYMLKKYMDQGRIDANLLGKKLNASVEKMTPEIKNPEIEEIMDMISIIENIISPLGVQEPVVTETTRYETKSDTTNSANQHESISIPAMKNSNKIVAPKYLSPQEELKNQAKHNLTQNLQLSAVQNVTKTRSFGRGRLFRKFKYPSIREQLNQQIRFNEDRSKNESPTYSLPLYTYPLTISERSDKAMRTSFSRVPIHHVSVQTLKDNVIQTSVSPFKDRLQNAAHQESEYGSLSADHDSPISMQRKQDQYLQQDQRSVADRNLLATVQNAQNQTLRYLPYESRSPSAEQGLEIAIQNQNVQEDQYPQYGSQISIAGRGLPVPLHDKNSRQDRYLHLEGKSLFPDHGLSVTSQIKNDQENRHLQHEGQSQTAGNGLKAYSGISSTSNAEVSASKFQENVSKFDNQKDLNRFDEIQRYREIEQRGIYKHSHPLREHARELYFRSTGNFETTGHFAKEESFSTNGQKFDPLTRPITAVDLKADEKSASFPYNENDDFVVNAERRQQIYADRPRDRASNKQTKKRKKLRILVKKVEDGEPKQPLPSGYDKKEIEERVSKSVLKSLRNRLLQKHAENIELQIQYQGHVWNIPFVNNESDLSPTICTRPGLFQHPRDCNMFYECFWDKWLRRFTLHVFACPVRLVYDHTVRGCSRPSVDSPCNSRTS